MISQRQRKRIKSELLEKIDKDDEIQVEKIERYMNLLAMYYSLDEMLSEQGPMLSVKNGPQHFMKINPIIAEKAKINSQLLAIEKTFIFKVEVKEKPRLI